MTKANRIAKLRTEHKLMCELHGFKNQKCIQLRIRLFKLINN